jgi:hypothetical protein
MQAAGYRHLARQLEDPDLFRIADEIKETMATPGWGFVVDSIAEHERRMTNQLLNETAKDEDIPRLRGLVVGLRSMQEAAQSILALADEHETKAKLEATR